MAPADKYTAVGQLFGVGTVKGEGAHLDRGDQERPPVGRKGDEGRDAGMVILAQQAGQLLAADGVGVVEEDDGTFADAVVAVVGDCSGLVPGFAAVVGAGENDGELLGVAAHDVGDYAQTSIRQIENAIGLEAHDVGFLGFRPGFAVVVAPV